MDRKETADDGSKPCVQTGPALLSQRPEEIHLIGSNLELREMRLRDGK